MTCGALASAVVFACAATAFANEQAGRALFLQNRSLFKENVKLNQALSMRGGSMDGDQPVSIVSTSEKIMRLLEHLRRKLNNDSVVDEIIKLMQGDRGLFVPDLSNLDGAGVDNSIRDWLLHGPARLTDQKAQVRRKATAASMSAPTPASTRGGMSSSLTQELNLNAVLVTFVCTTDFGQYAHDILKLGKQNPRPLCLVAEASLLSMDIPDSLQLNVKQTHRFLSRLDSAYLSSNPYHNAVYVKVNGHDWCGYT